MNFLLAILWHQQVDVSIGRSPDVHFLVPTNTQLLADVSLAGLHHPSALPVTRAAAFARISRNFEERDCSCLAITALIKSLDGVDDPQLMLLLLAHVTR